MDFYLYSGFLGSGKTTIIMSAAEYLTSVKKKKVMLIVNDVGDIGIDAQLMKKLDTDVFEIYGGCVCGQLGNLIPILGGIGTKYMVDTVLMEASGIAEPMRFIETIKKFVPLNMTVKTITIVDATRWLDLIQVIDKLLISQINSADIVVINKLDAVNKKTLDEVISSIKHLKDDVNILSISAANPEDILGILEVIQNE